MSRDSIQGSVVITLVELSGNCLAQQVKTGWFWITVEEICSVPIKQNNFLRIATKSVECRLLVDVERTLLAKY